MLFEKKLLALQEATMNIAGYLPQGITQPERKLVIPCGSYWMTLQESVLRGSYDPSIMKNKGGCFLCSDSFIRTQPIFGMKLVLAERSYAIHMTPYSVHSGGHFICSTLDHQPMKTDQQAIWEIANIACCSDTILVGMNGDLPNCGSSILEHQHYQILLNLKVPAICVTGETLRRRSDLTVELLPLPSRSLRISGAKYQVIDQTWAIVRRWKELNKKHHAVSLMAHHDLEKLSIVVTLRDSRCVFGMVSREKELKAQTPGLLEVVGNIVLTDNTFEEIADLEGDELRQSAIEYLSSYVPTFSPSKLLD